METSNIKRLEIDGPPAAGQRVIVDCGSYRCLGYRDDAGRWFDAIHGHELKNVTGYCYLN